MNVSIEMTLMQQVEEVTDEPPRQAIISSYIRPVMYKDFVLMKGKVVIKFS